MPSYPLRALVLRKTKLGESDLIVTLLARDGSQVRAVAKGARKPGSRFGARAEPFSVVDLLLHTGRTLEVISEAETVVSHDALRGDLDRSAAASVVADLLDKTSVEGQVEPKVFEMALVTLDVMESADVAVLPALVAAFLLKTLAMHGYRPALDECASCSVAKPRSSRFSVSAGGLLCERCAGDDGGAVEISEGACAVMRVLLRSTMADVAALEAPEALVGETLRVTAVHTTHHVPARLKALEAYLRHD